MYNKKLLAFCLLAASWLTGLPSVAVAATSQIPSAALPVVAETLARAQSDYHLLPLNNESGERTYQAHNVAHNIQAVFSSDRIHIKPQQNIKSSEDKVSWNLEMSLVGYGYRDALQPVVRRGDAQLSHGRIDYPYAGGLTEWYINSPVGLEHGFTLQGPPAAQTSEQFIVLRLKTSGDLQPTLLADGRAVNFSDTSGERVMRYGGLYAFDANGQPLPAVMRIEKGGVLALEVDVNNAIWPVTVDPVFSEIRKYTASDPQASNYFGASVTIDGEWMAVGANYRASGGLSSAGAVYLFRRVDSVWTQFVPPQGTGILQGNVEVNAYFGTDVAIRANSSSGSPILVVGANGEDGKGSNIGAAYVFEFGLFCSDIDLGTFECWSRKAHLTGSAAGDNDLFGERVDVDDDIIVIGAREDEGLSPAAADTGAAYIFKCGYIVLDGSSYCASWTEVTQLVPASGKAGDFFGFDVSISGDIVAVGASRDDSSGTDAGAVYVYRYQQTGNSGFPYYTPIFDWVIEQKITEGATAGSRLGYSVAVSGNDLVAGAPLANDVASGTQSGVAHVYRWSQTKSWSLDTLLSPMQGDNVTPDGSASDLFGFSVDISTSSYPGSRDYILVGSYKGDTTAVANAGSAYLYERNAGVWAQAKKITAPDAAANDYFGYAVALAQDMLVISSFLDDDAFANSGSIYTFTTPTVTSLDLELSTNSIFVGDVVSATVTLSVAGIQPGSVLYGQYIDISIRDASNNLLNTISSKTDSNGVATFSNLNLLSAESYTVTASYNGKFELPSYRLLWQAATSSAQTVLAQANSGYAVIIEGGYFAPGSAEELSTNKSANQLYQTLLSRGFMDQQIIYIGQDGSRPGVDALASKTKLGYLLMSNVSTDSIYSLLEQVTDNPAPIHFFLVGHAASGGYFYLNANGGTSGNGETLTATQLDSWLDTLEQIPQVASWPRTVTIATPYSAGFIPALSNAGNMSGRVIVASTTAGGYAFMGPEEQDGVPAASYFLSELVEEWGKGKNLDESFDNAAQRTRELTRLDDSSFSLAQQYEENALQQPLLEDNADGIGTWRNTAGSDGAVAATVFLGVGQTEVDDIFATSETEHLAIPSTFGLTVTDTGLTHSQWTIAVRMPGSGLLPIPSPAQISLPYERVDLSLVYSDPDFRFDIYGVNYDFSQSGRYEIWYWGEGNGKDTVSKRQVVMVDAAGNVAPEAVVLEQPGDGLKGVTINPSIFDWSQSVDPDGDAVWYKVVLSKSPKVDSQGRLTSVSNKSPELKSSLWLVEGDLDLVPLTRYYWQVQSYDRFGKIVISDIRDYETTGEPQFLVVGGSIRGLINGPTGGLQGAAIRWNNAIIAYSDFDGNSVSLVSEEGGYYYVDPRWLPFPGFIYCGSDNTYTQYDGNLDPDLTGYQVVNPAVGLSYCSETVLPRDFNMLAEVDADNDGTWDSIDNCPIYNPDQKDTDKDEIGDACDPDKDGDGAGNSADGDAFELDRVASVDTDGDGVPDSWNQSMSAAESTTGLTRLDNCTLVANPVQRDTDGDGYGNMCDGDLDNDINARTNTLDLNLYKLAHRTRIGDANYNPDADFNGDGRINTLDLTIFKGLYRKAPGPSGLAP